MVGENFNEVGDLRAIRGSMDLMRSAAGIPAGSPTYAASGSGYTAYATPTDLLTISGSASKTVAILNLVLWIQSTAAALQTIAILKRSAANTGGTLTNPALIPNNSAQAAATAFLSLYTAAPGALGASLGAMKTLLVASSTLTTTPIPISLTGASPQLSYPSLVDDIRCPILLHGVEESLCFYYGGAALTAGATMAWFAEIAEF